MGKHEFFHSTMRDVNLRIKAYKEEKEYRTKEIEYQSWLTGVFVLDAIGCSFSKGRKYPDNPVIARGNRTEEIAKKTGKSEAELAQEEQYFAMRVRQANANIGMVRKKKEKDSEVGADGS